MIKYNSKTIIKAYQNGNLINKIDKVVSGSTPSSRLPSGYTEVEYIDNISGDTTPTSSTKNNLAYIDINFIPNQNTRIVADMQVIQASQNPRYFGSGKWNGLGYIVSQEWTIGESRARIYCKYGQSSGWIETSYVPTMDRHTYDLNNNGKLVIDDVDIITLPTTSFTCDSSIVIFSASRINDTYVDLGETAFARLYSFKVYESGTLVRDLVPCTRDSDSKAGVYDLVNDVFYGSANSNPLIAGSPITPSTAVTSESKTIFQYVTDGTEPTPPTPPHDYSEDYLTFVATESGTFQTKASGVSYSIDNGTTWTEIAPNTDTPTVSSGDKILWKATNNRYMNSGFTSTGAFEAEGNAMSLIYGDNFSGETSLSGKNFVFCTLFKGCSGLTSAENLVLQATTLSVSAYTQMFSGCTSLTVAPELPATILASGCYQDMFIECSSLTTAPQLPATTVADTCYNAMFRGCTSLTTAPQLPATTVADSCYGGMFRGCTSLRVAPELPATTLARNCYQYMFYNCTSLTAAPELSATTLANNCYFGMFGKCTNLTTAPVLPANTLAYSCYQYMFNGCRSLTAITCLATDISASYCTNGWVDGVAASGVFTKAASMSDWESGGNGIPNNWTVQDYT